MEASIVGREETLEAKPDQISGGDLDDHALELTPLQISDGNLDMVTAANLFSAALCLFHLTNHFGKVTNMSLALIDFNQ